MRRRAFTPLPFPNSEVTTVYKAPGDFSGGKGRRRARSTSPCWAFPVSLSTAARNSNTARRPHPYLRNHVRLRADRKLVKFTSGGAHRAGRLWLLDLRAGGIVSRMKSISW